MVTRFGLAAITMQQPTKLLTGFAYSWLAGVLVKNYFCRNEVSPTLPPTGLATDVGMHGLLASQSCYHSVLPPCLSTLLARVAEFFIAITATSTALDRIQGSLAVKSLSGSSSKT